MYPVQLYSLSKGRMFLRKHGQVAVSHDMTSSSQKYYVVMVIAGNFSQEC